MLNGQEGFGFEIYYEEASEIVGEDEALRRLAAGRDYCISMVWRGSMNDCACAMIVSCALAKDFGAIVSYEGQPPEPLEKMFFSTHDIQREGAGEKPPEPKMVLVDKTQKQKPWWKRRSGVG